MKTSFFFFFQAEDGIRVYKVTGVQTCALPIYRRPAVRGAHQELRPLRGDRRGQRRRSARVQARDRDDQHSAIGVELLRRTQCVGGPNKVRPTLAPLFPRAIVIVMDSVGIGELPDASDYGDGGSN